MLLAADAVNYHFWTFIIVLVLLALAIFPIVRR